MSVNRRLLSIQIGVMAPLMFLCISTTSLRVYTNSLAQKRWPGVEESLVIAACVLGGVGCLAVLISELRFGSGVSDVHLHASQIAMQYHIQWFVFWIYTSNLLCIKIAILLLYRRLFSYKPFRRVCDAFLAFVVLTNVASMLSIIIFCFPTAYFWDRHLLHPKTEGSCINWEANLFAFGVVHIATNLAIVVLPTPLLLQLHLHRRKKMMISGLFGLGIIPVIAAGLRLPTIIQLRGDFTSHVGTHNTWVGIEMATAVICCNGPTMAPLLRAWFPGFLSGDRALLSGNNELKLRPDTNLDAVIQSMCEGTILTTLRGSRVAANKILVTVEQSMEVERMAPEMDKGSPRESLSTVPDYE